MASWASDATVHASPGASCMASRAFPCWGRPRPKAAAPSWVPSRHSGGSPGFAEKFREPTGITSIEYLTRLRMERARRLLRGDDSTAAVGEAVGDQSEAASHRAFKRAYGQGGPGAYRLEPGGGR